MLRALIVSWGVVAGAAALWTGRAPRPGYPRFLQGMTGLLPPHYGYSAYAVVPLLFLGPRWVRWGAAATLLLSGNRAAWVGVIAGWAWAGGRRRLALAGVLGLLAVVGGNALKYHGSRGVSARVQIWKAAARHAARHPQGAPFLVGVHGYGVDKAHSDVLQLAVDRGPAVAVVVLLLMAGAFYRLPEGPWKAVVVALSAQSVIDNRLHHPACAALYALSWLAAALERPAPRPQRSV